MIFKALIHKDQQPFSIVENQGFKALIAGGYQFYKLCSIESTLVYASYERDRSLLMVNLKMIKYCALTFDACSSRTANSFYLLNILLNVVKRYNFILIN